MAKIQSVLRSVFMDPRLQVDQTTNAIDVPGWDPVTHVRVLMGLEDEFGIHFDSLEANTIKNLGELADLIAAKKPGTPWQEDLAVPDDKEAVLDARRRAVDRQVEALIGRLADPALRVTEIQATYREFKDIYPANQFPMILEKRSLDMLLAADPGNEALRPRLRQVNGLLSGQWPLLGLSYDPGRIEEGVIAEDGVEALLLGPVFGQREFEHAIAAFHRYIEGGKPERFPPELAGRTIDYAQRKAQEDSFALRPRPAARAGSRFPEVDFRSTPLPEILQAYLEDGCVLLRNFLRADRLERLRSETDEIYSVTGVLNVAIGLLQSRGLPLFHERLFGYRQAELLDRLFDHFGFCVSPHTQSRRVDVGDSEQPGQGHQPLRTHIDAFFHDLAFTVNFWVPQRACGMTLPSLGVVCAPFADIKAFTGFGVQWEDHDDPQWNFGRFNPLMKEMHCHCNGLPPELGERFPGQIWTPTYEVGDVMMLSNWTLHFTHWTPQMSGRCENLELRFTSSASLDDILRLHGMASSAAAVNTNAS